MANNAESREHSKPNLMGNAPLVESFGWSKFRPKSLQRFCTTKWALFWLCWGGALQGEWTKGPRQLHVNNIYIKSGKKTMTNFC